MGELRDSGSTKLTLPLTASGQQQQPRDELLEAVRDTAGAEFDVLGELGRGPDGTIAYLARDLSTKKLVALRLTHGPAGEYLLEVVKQLDASVPPPAGNCPRCNAPVRGWGKFCTQCGLNLATEVAGRDRTNKEEMLKVVEDATRGQFEILGEMERAEGGGVYFAREIATGKIEALRLQREGEGQFSIGLTGVMKGFANALDPRKPPRGR